MNLMSEVFIVKYGSIIEIFDFVSFKDMDE